jgi:glycosyltransferase involved in cell wall biosynthesis
VRTLAPGADATVAVVIPARNEQPTLRRVAVGALAHAKLVIVVDDGSTDGTAESVADLPVVVLRNDRTCGKAASLWRGAHEALLRGAAAICSIDADGQHDPADIPGLLSAHREAPTSIIIGSRLHAVASIPAARYRANRVANFWIGWAAGYRIDDSQSGFRVYPGMLFRRARVRHDAWASFVFESEILIDAARLGVNAVCVPITVTYDNPSRPSYFRPVVDISRIVRMVAGRLLARGLYLPGLWRSLEIGASPRARSMPSNRS